MHEGRSSGKGRARAGSHENCVVLCCVVCLVGTREHETRKRGKSTTTPPWRALSEHKAVEWRGARFECEVRVESERRPSRPRATTRERESVLALSSVGLATASWPRERVRARGETSPRPARDAGGAHAGLYSVQALYRFAGQECGRRPIDMATALDGHVLVHGGNTSVRL